MKTWIGWLIVFAWAIGSARQIPVWSSDQALWTQAAAVNPYAVRPVVNLAAQAVMAGDVTQARAWMARARQLVDDPLRARERAAVLQILARQDAWINASSR